MKKIFLAMAMSIAFASADAQIVRIETENGTKVYDLSKIKSISFSDEANTEALADIEVINATPLSFDIKVTKAPSCQKYMVAVLPQSTFKEADFTFGAEQTLATDAYYRPYEETLSYDTRTFSETQLGINSLTDADGKAQTLVAAVYAVDDLGTVKVYTKEFKLPTTLKIESTLKMKIETSNIAYNQYTYTISPAGWTKPAKVIYGATQPAWMKTTMAAFNAKSDRDKRDFLLNGAGMPEKYTNKIQVTANCDANSDIIIYAMPIDENGKVGEMTIATLTTPEAEANGIGQFTGLTYKGETHDEDEYYGQANFEVSVENAVAYRLMWMVQSEFNDNGYSSTLVETFLNPRLGEYGVWKQFSASEKNAALDIVRPGQDYVLYGVTIDLNGNISQPIDLLDTFTDSGNITTNPKEEE